MGLKTAQSSQMAAMTNVLGAFPF